MNSIHGRAVLAALLFFIGNLLISQTFDIRALWIVRDHIINKEKINKEDYNALFFTSSNAVRNLNINGEKKNIKCFCVGSVTEKIARLSGFTKTISASGNVNALKNLIINSELKINQKIIKDPSKKIVIGDSITLEIPEPKQLSLKPYKYKLDIIFEDDDLIVLNKPSGIVMHPGAGNFDNTIVNALMNYDKNSLSNIVDELRPGIVHRID